MTCLYTQRTWWASHFHMREICISHSPNPNILQFIYAAQPLILQFLSLKVHQQCILQARTLPPPTIVSVLLVKLTINFHVIRIINKQEGQDDTVLLTLRQLLNYMETNIQFRSVTSINPSSTCLRTHNSAHREPGHIKNKWVTSALDPDHV